MNISEKKIDDLNLELSLKIEAADYAEPLDKRYRELKHKSEFKGFRKGMAPMSLIKKVYGDQVLSEILNRVVGEQLDGYITYKKLRILGEPLPSENQPENDWKEGADFTFVFDLGLSPEVSVEVVKEDVIPSYKITADAAEKNKMVENYKEYWSKKKDAEPKTDEEIEKEVSENLARQYENEASWRLSKDIREFYVKKSGIALPEAFLKRWLTAANKEKFSAEEVEKQFPGFLEDLKWQLVRGTLMKNFDLKVEEADLKAAAEAYVRYQYAMYGMTELPQQMLDETVANMMQDRSQISNLVEQVEDNKVMDKIKETATLKPKKISSAKFREL
ncbi:MAG: hypothetical protein II537_01225 [Bacteroidales bacterium]|nr:hypothetical protein [Bacteroidales bacterium]